VRYAGERAAECERARRHIGIPVEVADLEAVADACCDCGLPRLADQARALSVRRVAPPAPP
jgi:hypothetical protein